MTYEIAIDGKSCRLDLDQAEGRWTCRLDGRDIEVDAVLARPNVLSLRLGNKAYEVKCERVGADVHIWVGSRRFSAEVRDPRSLRSRVRADEISSDEIAIGKNIDCVMHKPVDDQPAHRAIVRVDGEAAEVSAGIHTIELDL